MNSCEFVTFITGVSCAIAKDKTVDELNILSAVFTQIGDTLATISVKRSLEENSTENNSSS